MKLQKYILFVVFILFLGGFAFAQDSCKDSLSITDLKEMLYKMQQYRDEAEKGMIESDKKLMKAQEIILLARAKGNVKAGQVAEEAARKAQEAKNKHRQTKEQAEKAIVLLKEYIEKAQRNNFECMTEVCNKYREQVDRDKEAFKRLLKEAEALSKRQNERLEEIYDEIKDYALDILPLAGELSVGAHKLYGKFEKFKRLQETNPEKYKQILITLDNLSNYYKEAQRLADLLDKGTKAIKALELSYEATSQYLSYIEKINENSKAAQKELERLRTLYSNFDIYSSQETYKTRGEPVNEATNEATKFVKDTTIEKATEFVIDTTIDEAIKNLGKLGAVFSKESANRLAEIAPYISALKSASDFSYHVVKIDFLNKEVNADYKLSDDQLQVYNVLKAQFDKDLQKLKECENYSKKLR